MADPQGDDTVEARDTRALTQGAARLLRHMGFAVLSEFNLGNGRRADLAGVDRAGLIAIVEVKSSVADFRADAKWPDYLDYCDRFYFAVSERFPHQLFDDEACLPERTGVIVADQFGGAIIRECATVAMNGSRRKSQLLRFARKAAERLYVSELPD